MPLVRKALLLVTPFGLPSDWIATPLVGAPRAGLSAATLLDGRVLVAGGTNSTGDLASPITGVVPAGSMSAARRNHLAFLLPHNAQVLVIGGTSAGTALSSAELCCPWTGAFIATGSLAAVRSDATGSQLSLDGLLLVAVE